MSLHYPSGDRRHPALFCDAPGCTSRLHHRDFRLAWPPSPKPHTGWAEPIHIGGDRIDYCANHADEAAAA